MMLSPAQDHKLFIQNRLKLSHLMPGNSAAILDSNDQMPRTGDQYFPFRQNSDLFYLCGINQEKTLLILSPHHPDHRYREVLFIMHPDEMLERWQGRKLSREEAQRISGIEEVHWLEELPGLLPHILLPIQTVYFNLPEDPKFRPDTEFRNERLMRRIRASYPMHKTERLAPLMQKLRQVKEGQELELMTEACRATVAGFEKVFETVHPGMWEYEVESEITRVFNYHRAVHAYPPIVAGGSNACYLHYSSNQSQLRDGDLLLVDAGAEWMNYASDCTRTIPVNGRFTSRQKEIYQAVLRILKQMMPAMTPGSSIDKLNAEMRVLMEEEQLRLGLFSKKELENQDPANPLFRTFSIHGLSHFIGLDVHDPGERSSLLEPGMVLSCEPGLYIPAENIGIRIENQLLITTGAAVNMTAAIPCEIEELEERLKK